jgi:hypothetical protein
MGSEGNMFHAAQKREVGLDLDYSHWRVQSAHPIVRRATHSKMFREKVATERLAFTSLVPQRRRVVSAYALYAA